MPATNGKARKMHKMYKAGDIDGVRAMIGSGVDVNARDAYGNALLHKAIRDETLVAALIEAGADVNVRVRDKWHFFAIEHAFMFRL